MGQSHPCPRGTSVRASTLQYDATSECGLPVALLIDPAAQLLRCSRQECQACQLISDISLSTRSLRPTMAAAETHSESSRLKAVRIVADRTEQANDLGHQTRSTRRVGHVTCDGGKRVQTGFGKRTFRRPWRRWEESIKRYLQEIGLCVCDGFLRLGYEKVAECCEHGNKLSASKNERRRVS